MRVAFYDNHLQKLLNDLLLEMLDIISVNAQKVTPFIDLTWVFVSTTWCNICGQMP